MNGEEAKTITTKLDGILQAQSEMKADLAGLRATAEVTNKQSEQQLAALFKYRNEHEHRIAQIERTYVPQGRLSDCRAQSDRVQQEQGRKLERLAAATSRWSGGIAAVAALVCVVLFLVSRVWR